MKNILLILMAFVLLLPAYAQTDKGSWLVGSSAALDYRVQASSRTLNTALAPQAGYFILDNLAVGVRLPLGLLHNRTETTTLAGVETLTKTQTYTVGLGPFVRYYFGKSAIRPFINVGGDYRYSRTTEKNNEDETARGENSYSVFGGAGMVFFLRNIGLETQLGYTYFRSGQLNKYSSLGLNVGLQIYIPQL